jgi:hypothetical protein
MRLLSNVRGTHFILGHTLDTDFGHEVTEFHGTCTIFRALITYKIYKFNVFYSHTLTIYRCILLNQTAAFDLVAFCFVKIQNTS